MSDNLKQMIRGLYERENPEKAKRLNDDIINNIITTYDGDYKSIIKGLYEKENPEKAKRLNDDVYGNISKAYGLDTLQNEQKYSQPYEAEQDTFSGVIPEPPTTEEYLNQKQEHRTWFGDDWYDTLRDIPEAAYNAGKSTIGSIGKAVLETGAWNVPSMAGKKIITSVFPGLKDEFATGEAKMKQAGEEAQAWGERGQLKTESKLGDLVGSLVPFIAIAASTPFTGPIGVVGATAAFGAMGLGEGLQAYDEYKKYSKEPVNELERAGAATAYALAYTLPLGHFANKMIPKGLIDKGFSMMMKNPEARQAAVDAGKEIFEKYATKSPGGAQKFLSNLTKKTADGAITMNLMEVGKEIADVVFVGKDITVPEILQRHGQATASGVIFGMSTAPFAYYGQKLADTKRRNDTGEVTLGYDKKKGPVEILPNPPGSTAKNKGMTPMGDIVDIGQETIDNSFTIPTELFNQQLRQVKETGSASPTIERDAMIGRLSSFADKIGYEQQEPVKTPGLGHVKPEELKSQILQIKTRDGKTYFAKEVFPIINKDGNKENLIAAIDENGTKHTFRVNDISDSRSMSKAQFVQEGIQRWDEARTKNGKPQPETVTPQPTEPPTPGAVPPKTPREQHTDLLSQEFDKLAHESGNLITVNHKDYGPVTISSGQVDIVTGADGNKTVKFTDPLATVWAMTKDGPREISEEQLADSPKVATKEDFLNERLSAWDTEQTRQELARQQSFEKDGKLWIDTGVADEKTGEKLIESLDDELKPGRNCRQGL